MVGFGKNAGRLGVGQNLMHFGNPRRTGGRCIALRNSARDVKPEGGREIGIGIVKQHHRRVTYLGHAGLDLGGGGVDPGLCRHGICGIGRGVWRVACRQFSGDQVDPHLGIRRIKPGMRINRTMFCQFVGQIDTARARIGKSHQMRARRVQQCHAMPLHPGALDGASQPWGHGGPDPEQQIGTRNFGGLRRTKRKVMGIRAFGQQQLRLAKITHHRCHQRMDRRNIGHHNRDIGKGRPGQTGKAN